MEVDQGADDEEVLKYNPGFKVATLKEEGLQLRAYFNESDRAEWLWGRVQAQLGIESYGGAFLKANMDALVRDCVTLQVPCGQIHYKQKGYQPTEREPWRQHTLESRALLCLVVTCLKSKPLKSCAKQKALQAILAVTRASFNCAARQGVVPHLQVHCYDREGMSQLVDIFFNEAGQCIGWSNVMQHRPVKAFWAKVSGMSWKGQVMKCPKKYDSATLSDIMLFLLYLATNPSTKSCGEMLWETLGQQLLTSFICFLGENLEKLANELTHQPLEELPILTTRKGYTRKDSDPINKFIILERVQGEKVMRWRVAKTHKTLISQHCTMMKMEPYLETALHYEECKKHFGNESQIFVSWDPSTYGGCETMVAVVYSERLDLCAYLLTQPLRKLFVSDLDASLQAEGRAGKLTRIAGFSEVRALSKALSNIGCPLTTFQVPDGLLLRPLKRNQERVKDDRGNFWIVDKGTGERCRQVPEHLDLAQVPCLISCSDQGPQNLPALNFLQYAPEGSLVMACIYDGFHRCWNDIKTACRKAKSFPWRCILETTIIFNCPYGPFGSSQWFDRKRDALTEFMQTHSSQSPNFLEAMHDICKEQGRAEPADLEGQADLYESLRTIEGFSQKGPLVKLMRWFSWFESATWYTGQLYATKLVLEGFQVDNPQLEEEPAGALPDDQNKTAAQHLSALKKARGGWKLGYELITPRNIELKDMLLQICRASWKLCAERAKNICSPAEVLAFNIKAVTQKGWLEEIEMMVDNSCWRQELLEKQFHEEPGDDHTALVEDHGSFLDELLYARVKSLAVERLMPPFRYNATLSEDPVAAGRALHQVQTEWKILLKAEQHVVSGGKIPFMASLMWAQNPFTRLLYLAYEQSAVKGCHLQRLLAKNLGDSRVIEVAHNSGKDTLRSSRRNTFAQTKIFHSILQSQALEQRRVRTVKVNPDQKVFASGSKVFSTPIRLHMQPRNHKLPLSMQNMMKKGAQKWPSPSPQSLFPILGATEWLFRFYESGSGYPKEALESAWKTCLAGRAGAVVAMKSTGSLFKVLASAEYAMLTWRLNVRLEEDKPVYMMEASRELVEWHHAWDLSDWLYVPTKPVVLNKGAGPMVWVKTGSPQTFIQKTCLEGVSLTVVQMKHLLADLGVTIPKGTRKRADFQALLIEACLHDQELQDIAKGNLGKQECEDKEGESDLDEILSILGEDDANFAEVKKYRAQVGKKRAHKKQKQADQALVDSNKKRGRGRGRGRGRPRGRGRGGAKDGKGAGKGRKHKLKEVVKHALKHMLHKWGHSKGKTQEEEEEANTKEPHCGAEQLPKPTPQPSQAPEASQPSQGAPAPEAPAASSSSQQAVAPAACEPEPSQEQDASGSGHPPKKRFRLYTSPEEAFVDINPPGCKMRINFNDHRFVAHFPHESAKLNTPLLKQKHFSRTFDKRPWKESLCAVHQWAWNKWSVLKDELPLGKGKNPQEPGQVPNSVFEGMEQYVTDLPEKTKY